MQDTQQLMSGMDAESLLQVYSEGDKQYRITFHCGRAEAARRQRVAGNGSVTDEGYVRTTNGDFLASIARSEDGVTVEVIDE